MAYTPELSQKHSGTLRRIAWALDQPMTTTLEAVFDWVGKAADATKVCSSCRDKSLCQKCVFHRNHENN
jgi:hypothetical protein